MGKKCRLCELVLNPDSEVYYEDEHMILLDGIKKDNYKKKILAIWKKHEKELSEKDLKIFINKLIKIKTLLSGIWDIVIGLYSIPEHFHAHLGESSENWKHE